MPLTTANATPSAGTAASSALPSPITPNSGGRSDSQGQHRRSVVVQGARRRRTRADAEAAKVAAPQPRLAPEPPPPAGSTLRSTPRQLPRRPRQPPRQLPSMPRQLLLHQPRHGRQPQMARVRHRHRRRRRRRRRHLLLWGGAAASPVPLPAAPTASASALPVLAPPLPSARPTAAAAASAVMGLGLAPMPELIPMEAVPPPLSPCSAPMGCTPTLPPRPSHPLRPNARHRLRELSSPSPAAAGGGAAGTAARAANDRSSARPARARCRQRWGGRRGWTPEASPSADARCTPRQRWTRGVGRRAARGARHRRPRGWRHPPPPPVPAAAAAATAGRVTPTMRGDVPESARRISAEAAAAPDAPSRSPHPHTRRSIRLRPGRRPRRPPAHGAAPVETGGPLARLCLRSARMRPHAEALWPLSALSLKAWPTRPSRARPRGPPRRPPRLRPPPRPRVWPPRVASRLFCGRARASPPRHAHRDRASAVGEASYELPSRRRRERPQRGRQRRRRRGGGPGSGGCRPFA